MATAGITRTLPPRPRRGGLRIALAGFGLGAALGAAAWTFLLPVDDRGPVPGTASIQAVSASTATTLEGLQNHLRSTPDDWQSWARLGLAYVEAGRVSANPALYPRAEGAFDRSLNLNVEQNAVALAGRGAAGQRPTRLRSRARMGRKGPLGGS